MIPTTPDPYEKGAAPVRASVQFSEAILAGFLSAEIQVLSGIHPEIIYNAIMAAEARTGIRVTLTEI